MNQSHVKPGRHVSFLLAVCIVVGDGAYSFGQGMAMPHPQVSNKIEIKSAHLPEIRLEDIATQSGLTFQHVAGDPKNKTYLLEATGGGVAVFDYDGDGLPDIFLVNGDRWKPDGAKVRPTGRLYRNLGNLKFQDVTDAAGLRHAGWGQGVCVGDYDNDGREDLYVTYYGHNILYHNEGGGHFTDVTAQAGLPMDGSRWGTGCAFVDYDRDGRLDIAVANYASFDVKTTPLPGSNVTCFFKELPVMCGPRGLQGGANVLYHNAGNGRFVDVSAQSHFNRPFGYYCFSVVTGDFDGDGWPDLFLACDSTPNIMLHNNRDGTFKDVGPSSGTAFNESGEEQGSMGADAADYTHNGRLGLVVTTFDDDVPALFLNETGDMFSDVYLKAGLGTRTHQVGWGTAFVDLDNDGWQDIFMVNGHVYPNVDRLKRESHYRESKNLYYNLGGGTFADMTELSGAGTVDPTVARGLAIGDFANDGSMDLVVNNLDGRPNLLVNRSKKGNWLGVKLVGTISNRDAIGAQARVTAGKLVQMAEVKSGCCYMSQSDMRLHFGLGAEQKVDLLEIRWPNGGRETFHVPNVNSIIEIREGSGTSLSSPD